MADGEGSRVLHVDADAMVVYPGENGINENKENLEDYSFVEAHYPYLKRKYEEDNSEKNGEVDVMLHMKKFQRRENFSDSEKCDLVDVICCEELEHDEEIHEKFIIRLRSRTTPNKFKKVLYEQVAAKLEARGYKRRDSVSIKRMWNQLFGDYQKAVNFLKTKAGMNSFKHKPWIMKIYEAVRENNLPDHLFMENDVDETENDIEIVNDNTHDDNDCDSNELASEFDSEKGNECVQQKLELEAESKFVQRKPHKTGVVKLRTVQPLSGYGLSSKATKASSHKSIQCNLISQTSHHIPEQGFNLRFSHGIDQLPMAVLQISKGTSSQKLEEMKLLLDCYAQENENDRKLEKEKLDLQKIKEEHYFIIEKLKMDFALKFGCFPTAGTPCQD